MTLTISDPTLLVRAYNIKPRQCQTPRFSRETTISGPEHDTYNLRPHVFRVRLQYQAPKMSDPTLFARDYNIRYLCGINWSFNGVHTLCLQVDDLFSPIRHIPVFENSERCLPVLSMNITI